MNVQDTTAIMNVIVQMGGFTTGGLNFDCKVRRESIDPIDLMYGHIGAIDAYAFGLRKAIRMNEKKIVQQLINERYISWSSTDIGQNILNGTASLEDCTNYALTNPEPKAKSSKQELYEIIRNTELYRR
jgi:xylose isomerase